jgi:hypothetical protein
VLTPFDDYPIHQTPAPITQPESGDPNHYDRYFFNGHEQDGEFFIGGAMGHYPNRDVVDAAFSVVHDGIEHSVFASGRMPRDRATEVGPIRVEVVEPLRAIRLVVAPNEHGLSADLLYRARTVAIEEPRQTVVRDGKLVMDYTRLTQWGTWEGEVRVGGTTLTVDPARVTGTRDRSWGVRGVGAQAPTNAPPGPPAQIFWLWAPLHFDDVCTHLAMFERADGERWLESSLIVPVLASPDAPTWGPEDGVEHLAPTGYRLRWRPGRREIETAELTLHRRDGSTLEVVFEPNFSFRMRGIGYWHPHWSHGSVHGELEVGGESIKVADFDPEDLASIHIQTACRVRMTGDGRERVGTGVLEQLAIGPHEPTGLTGLTTGWQPPT